MSKASDKRDAAKAAAEADKEERFRVQIGPVGENGVDILGHPCKDGMVIELPQSTIDAHQAGGVPLLDVPDDYKGEVYDVHVPYVNPEHEEVA